MPIFRRPDGTLYEYLSLPLFAAIGKKKEWLPRAGRLEDLASAA